MMGSEATQQAVMALWFKRMEEATQFSLEETRNLDSQLSQLTLLLEFIWLIEL